MVASPTWEKVGVDIFSKVNLILLHWNGMKLFSDEIDEVDTANPISTSEESLQLAMNRKECEPATMEVGIEIQLESGELELPSPAIIF